MVVKMKTVKEIKNVLAGNMDELKQKYGIKELGIFGSYMSMNSEKQVMLIFS